jgi:hypothetical protein
MLRSISVGVAFFVFAPFCFALLGLFSLFEFFWLWLPGEAAFFYDNLPGSAMRKLLADSRFPDGFCRTWRQSSRLLIRAALGF